MLAAIDKTKNRRVVDNAVLYKKLKEQFVDPGVEYRGKPFWAWNNKLDKDELLFQIEVMHQMGMGGFFMHSRTGLQTPYLGDEWFALIRACCEKAKSLGMQAWLYDEDRWPSGFAGGIVTEDESLRQKRLQLRCVDAKDFVWNGDILAAFSANIEGTDAYGVRRLRCAADAYASGGRHVLVFTAVSSPTSESYNGQAYVDTLSEKAIKRFIEVTHNAYREHIGEYFGSVVQGIFTDEPNHGPTCVYAEDHDESVVIESPWTDSFPDVFRRKYGYDIIDNLAAVFFDIDGCRISKPRADYHDCKTSLFVNAFAKQIWQWCQQNNMLFTGHVLNESPLIEQVSFVGSAMRFYEYMDIPGIDILTDRHLTTGGRPEYDTVKQCVSVQRQMGRKQVLSELYGCTGWDFSLEGHKACGDWQAALGVNFRCHHHLWYSMQGQAKRDYPASISYQSPWWQQYSNVEDYFSRINVLMTQGDPMSKLLVIHPNESIWQMVKPGWCTKKTQAALMHEWSRSPEINELEEKYLCIRDSLIKSNIDFDYGDEEMISRLGEIDMCEGKFNLGCCSYNTVLVPPLKTIRRSTLDLLEKFIGCGGNVVVVEKMPDHVDALMSKAAVNMQRACVVVALDHREITDAVSDLKTIDVIDEHGNPIEDILCRCIEDDCGRYIFICNTNKVRDYVDIKLKIYDTDEFECVQRWDPYDGKNYCCDVVFSEGYAIIKTSLPACGSDLLVLLKVDVDAEPVKMELKVSDVTEMKGPFNYSLKEHNVLVLDRAGFAINSQWQPSLDILEIDNKLREKIGLKSRNGKMLQPWISKYENVDCRVELVFDFNAECIDHREIFLALEKPESILRLELNGSKIATSDTKGWWIDKSLQLVKIPVSALKQGNNKLYADIDYNLCMGLEAMYLLGSFGVRVDGSGILITERKDEIGIGDWCKQGLPFYSGSVRYEMSADIHHSGDDKVFIELPRFDGSCAAVYINGVTAGTLWCRPYQIEITDLVGDGHNDVVIEVVSHRRNTLGPLHLKGGGSRPGWTGPGEFVPVDSYRQDEYNLVSCGLIDAPLIIYKKEI